MPRVESWRVPSLFIRDMLSDAKLWDGTDIQVERLADGRVRASLAEIHRAYRRRLKQENALRPRAQRIHGMRYASTERYVTLLRTIGAVAAVGTKPLSDPRLSHLRRFKPGQPPGEALQVIYERVLPPDDWRWVFPWIAAAGKTPTRPVEVPEVVTTPITPIPTFTLPERPSRAAAQALEAHLRELDIDSPGVQEEFKRLADEVEKWQEGLQGTLDEEQNKETPDEERVDRLEQQISDLGDIIDAMRGANFLDVSLALDAAFPPRKRAAPKAKPPKVAKPKGTLAERLEGEAAAFIPRIQELRQVADVTKLTRLEEDMVNFFGRVLDQVGRVKGEQKERVNALADRLERSAVGFEAAAKALKLRPGPRARREYEAALDKLLTCCPPA